MKERIVLCLLIACLATACAGDITPAQPTPTATPPPPLPRSMKGYNLFSWQVGDEWHFTLITGTNRTKTVEEVTTGEDRLTEDGWVRIHVQGVEAIKGVLSRVPAGEWVLWADQGWPGLIGTGEYDIILPPQAIVDEVKQHADQLGLQMQITQ